MADGFHIDSNGNLWIGSASTSFDSSANFYVETDGTLHAESGDIGGLTIGSNFIQSSNYTSSGSGAGFRLQSDGNAIFYGTVTGLNFISPGGAATDINDNSTKISGGKIQANSLDVNSVITNDLSFSNLSIGSQDIIDTLVDNAILAKIGDGQISQQKLGSISANKISGGTISGDLISGGTITFGTSIMTSGQHVLTGLITISPTTSGSVIGAQDSNTTIRGGSGSFNSLNVDGFATIDNTLSVEKLKDVNGSTEIDFLSTFMDFKPNGSLALRVSTAQVTSYENLKPNSNNSLDLGSSGARWRDIYTQGAVNTSDINLKTDVQDLALGLEFLNTLEPIQYKWTDGGVRTHAGFSAQDIEQKLIDYGVESTDYGIFTNSQITEDPEEDSVYGLRTSELVSVLTKSIQELSAKNDELESRIEALES